MRKFGVIILVLSTSSLFGQQVKRVVTSYPNSKDAKEVYYVLESDKTIKQGEYYSVYEGCLSTKELETEDIQNDEVMGFKERGHFVSNLREGPWTFYRAPEKTTNSTTYNAISEEGKYIKDQKKGIWNTYVENGKVIKRFDHDNNKELEPVVPFKFDYPTEARKNSIEGTVKVKVSFKNCEPTTYEIIEDIGYGCGDSVIKALREKRELEKKYGVASTNCDKLQDTLSFKFKLPQ